MAEEIVACPGCAKKFRIPEGAASGTFPCTACGADVPYGAAAAKKSAARPAAAPAQRAPAPAPRPAPAAAPRAAAAPARRAAPASSRRAARAEPQDEPKSSHAAAWWAIGIGGAALLALVYFLTRPTAPTTTAPTNTAAQPAKPPEKPAEKPATAPPAEAPKPEPAANAPAANAPAVPAEAPKPEPSATEKPKTPDPVVEVKQPERAKPKGDYATLGQSVVSTSDTTAEERADFDRMVLLAVDLDSGKDGAAAFGKLTRAGKKALPTLLSALSTQYSAGKWSTEKEQYAAYQVQQILRDIVRSDGRPEYFVPFQPGGLMPAEDFEKAAKMWFDWWNTKGQFITKFRAASSND